MTTNGEIRYIQEGVMASIVKDEITRLTSELARHKNEDCDPFIDLEDDEDESEQNEIVVDNVLED